MRIRPKWYIFYLILLNIFLIAASIHFNFSKEGIQAILPNYLMISTAILAVAFAAGTIKEHILPQERGLIGITIATSVIGIFTSIFDFYYSYFDSQFFVLGVYVVFYCATFAISSSIFAAAALGAELFTIEKKPEHDAHNNEKKLESLSPLSSKVQKRPIMDELHEDWKRLKSNPFIIAWWGYGLFSVFLAFLIAFIIPQFNFPSNVQNALVLVALGFSFFVFGQTQFNDAGTRKDIQMIKEKFEKFEAIETHLNNIETYFKKDEKT